MKPVISLMIDSGAYSAWTRGKPVKIDAYADFLVKYKEIIWDAVSLDSISPSDPEKGASEGRNNFLYLLDRGLPTIPVFHAREKFKWLDMMLADSPYIGLSATSLVSPLEGRSWHDIVWAYITDEKGRAIVKTHSFGNTDPYTMMAYPFYSADSATWMIQAGRAARIKLQGKSYQIRSTMLRDTSFVSVDDPAPKKEAWEAEIRELGLNPDILMKVVATQSEIAMLRSYLVASDLLKLQEKTRPITTFKAASSLFGNKYKTDGGTERDGPVKLFMAISPSAYYFNLPILAALKITNILCSYHYIATAPKTFMEERLIPFLYDPVGFCEREPKLRRYWNKLNEVIQK